MSDRHAVRLGVVGCGFMGQIHAENAVEFGHEVVAGADLDPDRREEFARSYDAAGYEDFEAMYDEEALDAVAVSVPNAVHEPAAVGALERGIDVLCEKPLAHDLASAERIAAVAADADAFCTVNFHNRITPAVEAFTAYRERGRFGDVTHVRGNYVRSRGIPGHGTWFTDADLAGGGAVVDIGVHAIDFALYLLGFPAVETVSAVTRTEFGTREDYVDPDDWYENADPDAFDLEDSATALVRCADDRTISLEVAWAANEPESQEFVARGTEAGARLSLGGDDLTLFEASSVGPDHLVESATAEASLEHSGWEGSDKLFLDAVAIGEAPDLNTVEQALTVQRVIDAIYRSAETGDCVGVEE